MKPTSTAATSAPRYLFGVSFSWNGSNTLTDLDVIQEGDNYVYYYGETDLQSRADDLLQTVKRKGFSGAKIVEFETNKKLEGGKNYRVQFMTSNKKTVRNVDSKSVMFSGG